MSSFWAGGGSTGSDSGFAQPGQGGQQGSSSSGHGHGHSKRTGAGRSNGNFWLGGDDGGEGGPGASLSGEEEDQLDEPDAGFGLHLGRPEYSDSNSNSNTPSAGVHVGASSPSTMLGLTSMDFWSLDSGSAANPSSGIAAAAAGRSSPSRAAEMDTRDFIKQEEMDDAGDNEFNSLFTTLEDPLVRARREMAFSRTGAGGGFHATSPEGMDFDDLVNTESFGCVDRVAVLAAAAALVR